MKKRLIDIMYIGLSIALIYGIDKYTKRDIITTEIIKYDTIETYDDSIPKNNKNILVEGKNGY